MEKNMHRGFTLIELMIVVGIIGIIVAIALPNYQEYIRSSRRGAAATCTLEMAQQMERRYTSSLAYNSTTTFPVPACMTGIAEFYNFGFAAGEPTVNTYIIQATPIGSQNNECGILTLNQRTVKGANNLTTDAALIRRCWK